MLAPSIFNSLAEIEKHGSPAALCVIVKARGSVPRHVGSKMIVYADGHIEGTIGGGEMESRVIRGALEAIKDGEAKLVNYELIDPKSGDPGVCGGELEIFVEPIKPKPTLLVIGGGHVGKALTHLGKWLGFYVVLNDDRAEFCNPQSVPDADEYLVMSIADLASHFTFHSQTYIVMSTRGMAIDIVGLPTLLHQPCAYIGVIGSRRRWATAVKRMKENGVSEEKLLRVYAPMGLELNAETPEEIALSILSEVVLKMRGGTGESMKWLGELEERK